MADFSKAFAETLAIEGGYSNHPTDRGGETYKGIARKKHPSWSGWSIIDSVRWQRTFPNNLEGNTQLQQAVRAFYKENFWNRLSLDNVNDQRIACELFDTGVNMGTGVAATMLQRVLNVTNRSGNDYPNLMVDAQIGPKTIAALNGHRRPGDVLKALNILQGARYIDICEASESQEVFFSGWLTRVSLALLLFFVTLAGQAQTITADRVVARQGLYLRDSWADSIQRDTAFSGRVRSLPTSEAVRQFVAARLAASVSKDSSYRRNDSLFYSKNGIEYKLGTFLTRNTADLVYSALGHTHDDRYFRTGFAIPVPVFATVPAGGVNGWFYYNSALNSPQIYAAGAWRSILTSANTGDFLQMQNSIAQPGNFWMSGAGRMDGSLTVGSSATINNSLTVSGNSSGNTVLLSSGSNGTWAAQVTNERFDFQKMTNQAAAWITSFRNAGFSTGQLRIYSLNAPNVLPGNRGFSFGTLGFTTTGALNSASGASLIFDTQDPATNPIALAVYVPGSSSNTVTPVMQWRHDGSTMLGALTADPTNAPPGTVWYRSDLTKFRGNEGGVYKDIVGAPGGSAGVASFNGRTGSVVPQSGDYTPAMVGLGNVPNVNATDPANISQSATHRFVSDAEKAAWNAKENAFSKNSAFNKPFGTTAGTVAEGNDERIIKGATAHGWGNHAGLYLPSATSINVNGTNYPLIGNPSITIPTLPQGSAPVVGSIDSRMGTGASVVVEGTQTAGKITFTAGSNPTGTGHTALFTLNFSTAFSTNPYPVVTPASGSAALLNHYAYATTTALSVNAMETPSAGQSYIFYYNILQ